MTKKRTVEEINADLHWVNSLLQDSQEHSQIVHLEKRMERLWAEKEALGHKP